MVLTLEELPVELLDLALQYLPLSDLLSFARTSQSNYQLAIRALTSLDLAIFPRRIYSLLAFFDASNDSDEEDNDGGEDPPISKYWARRAVSDKSLHQIGLTTPSNNTSRTTIGRSKASSKPLTITGKQRKAQHLAACSSSSSSQAPPTALSLRTSEITSQNTLATTVLLTPTLTSLHNLTLRLYDLTSPTLATTLATNFPTLHTLTLDFSHPYIHDTTLPAQFWKETLPTGSPIWNILSGTGAANSSALTLRNLRSLRLNRSGITSFQLRHWVAANPELRELRLSLCRGVDRDFTSWLAEHVAAGRGKVEVVALTDCALLELQSEDDFAWVASLARSGVRELSLKGCRGVSEDTVLSVAAGEGRGEWRRIRKLVSPKGVVVRRRRDAVLPSRSRSGVDGEGHLAIVHRSRVGSVSPALTVSDGMVGASRAGYFGKIEVDPAAAL